MLHAGAIAHVVLTVTVNSHCCIGHITTAGWYLYTHSESHYNMIHTQMELNHLFIILINECRALLVDYWICLPCILLLICISNLSIYFLLY